MFVLFGWGKKTVKDFHVNQVIHCNHCNNTKPWQYKKVTSWVTLFFIPVIPYQIQHIRVCPICGQHDKMSKEDFSAIVEDGVTVDIGGLKAARKGNDGKTETQANYLREMAALKAEEKNR